MELSQNYLWQIGPQARGRGQKRTTWFVDDSLDSTIPINKRASSAIYKTSVCYHKTQCYGKVADLKWYINILKWNSNMTIKFSIFILILERKYHSVLWVSKQKLCIQHCLLKIIIEASNFYGDSITVIISIVKPKHILTKDNALNFI